MSEHNHEEVKGGVEAVERALTVLNAFGETGKANLTLHELAEATGFYKSTILRLAVSLERFAYLRRRDDGRFQLGSACARLATLQSAGMDKGELLQAVVKSLAEKSGETSSYYVRAGDGRTCVFRENSTRAVRHHVEIGDRLPLERGAAGLALLAFSGARGERFRNIRLDGLAVSLGEREADAAGIAAPVFDTGGVLLGALTISGVITRFTPAAIERFRTFLLEAVAHLDREFGVPHGLRPDPAAGASALPSKPLRKSAVNGKPRPSR